MIIGGTSSFGQQFIQMTLDKYNPKKIIVFSRDEMNQWEMAKLFTKVITEYDFYRIGDVRDRDRLYRALDGVDYAIYEGETKIFPTAEYNPFVCIKKT